MLLGQAEAGAVGEHSCADAGGAEVLQGAAEWELSCARDQERAPREPWLLPVTAGLAVGAAPREAGLCRL